MQAAAAALDDPRGAPRAHVYCHLPHPPPFLRLPGSTALPSFSLLSPGPSAQDPAYGGDPSWLSNDVVQEYDGRIYLNLPASCTLMLVQQG